MRSLHRKGILWGKKNLHEFQMFCTKVTSPFIPFFSELFEATLCKFSAKNTCCSQLFTVTRSVSECTTSGFHVGEWSFVTFLVVAYSSYGYVIPGDFENVVEMCITTLLCVDLHTFLTE